MKKRMTKVAAIAMAAALAAGMLAGCGGSGSSGGGQSAGTQAGGSGDSGKAAQSVTLNFAIPLAEEEWQVFREDILAPFEAETGIKVNGIQMENKDMESKLEALAQAGKHEIDVFAPSTVYLPGILGKDLAEDLTGLVTIPEAIPGNLYEELMFDGKVTVVPIRPNVQTNYYNEAKLNEYGLTPPQNWDELLAFAKTLHEKEGVGRVAIQAASGSALTITCLEFIRSAGGDPLVLNDAGSVEAFTFLQQLWPYLSPESKRADFNGVNELLATESIYYGSNWPFCVTTVVKDGGKTEVKSYVGFEGPKGISKVTTTTVVGIAKGTEHKEEALKFVEYLMSEKVQNVLFTKIGWAPARNDALGEVEEWQKPYIEDVMTALDFAQSRPIVPYWSDVDKAINDAFTEIVINGESDVQGILDKYHNTIEEAKQAKGE